MGYGPHHQIFESFLSFYFFSQQCTPQTEFSFLSPFPAALEKVILARLTLCSAIFAWTRLSQLFPMFKNSSNVKNSLLNNTLNCPILPKYPSSSLGTDLFFFLYYPNFFNYQCPLTYSIQFSELQFTPEIAAPSSFHDNSLAYIHIKQTCKSDKHFISTLQYCH